MRVNHYPGSSTPKMGEGVRPYMPKQRPRKSFAGDRSGSGSKGAYGSARGY